MARLFRNKSSQSSQKVKKEKQVVPVLHCEDCAHATPDMKFENLSLDGKPTLLICPFDKWKKLFKEPACDKFKPISEPEPEEPVMQEISLDNIKLNDDNQYTLF